MAQVHDATGSRHTTRRAPNAHSDAVQEAKRLEKMQAHSSSHRSSGPAAQAPAQAAAATDAPN